MTGTSHYQGSFENVLAGPTQFRLIPEPRNAYDANAVEVRHLGHRIGYMSAKLAVEYQPIIQHLEQGGEEVWVEGSIEDPDEGGSRASFQIPWPDFLAKWTTVPVDERASVLLERVEVTLKRLGDYQDQLGELLAGRQDADVAAEMVAETTPKGKYKDEPYIRFDAAGMTIGLLPAQYRFGNEAFFEALEAGTKAVRVHLVYFEDTDTFWAKARLE